MPAWELAVPEEQEASIPSSVPDGIEKLVAFLDVEKLREIVEWPRRTKTTNGAGEG